MSKKKGNLLEDLVAILHQVPGVEVTPRAKLPVQAPGRRRTREIDVLLEAKLAGYPVRFAIECKNWKKRVGVAIVDALVGKLTEVGVPVSHGIIVSAVGYTAGAIARAQAAGIRVLDFEGLSADRLDRVVREAFQSIVYVVLTWQRMQRFDDEAPSARPKMPGLIDATCARHEGEPTEQWALRALWEKWRSAEISLELGERLLMVCEPEGSAVGSEIVFVTALVQGHVFTIPGELRTSKLTNAITKQVEKMRLDASFPDTGPPLTTQRLTTEAELQAHAQRGALHVVLGRVRVPRLELAGAWFPPSRRAMERFVELRNSGEEPTFEKIEGLDIRRAWDEPVDRRELRPD